MINQSNEILCRLRGEDESRYPGLLTTTIGTHVELNENYLSTLQKYIPFELQLMWHGEFRVDDGFENEVCGLYMATIDSNKLPLEFKSDRRFLSKNDLENMIKKGKTTPHLQEAFYIL